MIQVGKRSEGGQVTCYNSGPGMERGERGRGEGREGREKGEGEREGEGGGGGGRGREWEGEGGRRGEGGGKEGKKVEGTNVRLVDFNTYSTTSLIFHN